MPLVSPLGAVRIPEDLSFPDLILQRVQQYSSRIAFVAPAELEALLLQQEAVADVAVVGVPDEAAGELPRAYIVLRAGATTTQAELLKFVADNVSPVKKLRGGIKFVDTIPKLPSGKILRRVLRDWIKQG